MLLGMKQKSYKVLRQIPILKALTSFDLKRHRAAFGKFAALWIISILPIVFAIIAVSENTKGFGNQVRAAFSSTHQFIYAITYLAPLLYLFFEKFKKHQKYVKANKRSPQLLGTVPDGYEFILLFTFILFTFTAFAYGATLLQPTGHPQPRFNEFSASAAIWIYLYGLYCWYLTIVMESDVGDFDFVEEGRRDEAKLQTGFRERITQREQS